MTKVTFITPTYNHAKYIEKCIQSVISQDYPDVEQIIIDDGSTDNTEMIVRNIIKNYPNIKYYRQEHLGVNRLDETYNYALSKSTGDIVAILEGDDWAYSYRASEHVKAMVDPSVVVSWGYQERWSGRIYLGTSPTNYRDFENMDRNTFIKKMFEQCYVASGASAIRKTALKDIGGFRHGKYYVDYPTWLALIPKGEFKYIHKPLTVYGIHGNNHSIMLGSTARPDLDAIEVIKTYPDDLKEILPSEKEIRKSWFRLLNGWRIENILHYLVKHTPKKLFMWATFALYYLRSTYAIPTSLGVCITPYCNIKCRYCMREQFIPPGKPMTVETLKYIMEEKMPYIGDVCIMGLCEPYLNPDLPKMLRYIKTRNVKIQLTTNGTIPIKDMDALRCVDSFVISIDTADPDTFTYLRGGAKFDRVMDTFKSVIEWKRKNGLGKLDNPPLHINAVITQQNIDQMPGLFALLEPYADDLTYLMVDAVSRPDYQSFERPLSLTGDEFAAKINEIKLLSKKSPLSIIGFDYMLQPSKEWDRCALTWFGMYIQPNGDANFMFDYKRTVGNIFDANPLFVWNSKIARDFRRKLMSPEPPIEQCKSCNFARKNWQPGGVYITEQGEINHDIYD